jgi:uncharacterized membrane protein
MLTLSLPTQGLATIHPLMVHWPFTLAVLALAGEVLSFLTGSPFWTRAGFFALVACAAAMLATDGTGFMALAITRVPPGTYGLLKATVLYALSATALGLIAVALRWKTGRPVYDAGKRLIARAPTWTSLVLVLGVVVLLGFGDHAGYLLVYQDLIGTRVLRRPRLVLHLAVGRADWLVIAAGAAVVALVVGSGALTRVGMRWWARRAVRRTSR